MKKIKQKKLIWLILVTTIFLVGCDQVEQKIEEVVSSQVEESVTTEVISQVEEEMSVDNRFVPEISQVIADFRAREDIQLSEQVSFEISDTFTQTQNSFQFNVDRMQVYEVDSIDESLESEFNYESDPGAIVLLEVSITNLTDDTIYYPIEGLRMSYQSASVQMHPSSALYPSQSGNLVKILEQNNNEIGPSMTVNGYIVYSFGATEWEEVSDLGNVYLTVIAPQADANAITGVGASELGDERALYLPVNEDVEAELLLNNEAIGDRLSTEWWGNKDFLARETLNETDSDGDVSVELIRVELSDFKPHDNYASNFQNFNFGQIIMSIEYEITNNSEYDLLPVDGQASIQIGEDPIHSDYVLINDFNGTILEAGKAYRTVKSFALDKMRYYEVWQGEPMYIAINVPVKEEVVDNSANSEEDSEEVTVSDSLLYFFEFSWTPQLEKFINDKLDVVDENPNSDEELNGEESSSDAVENDISE